MNVIVCIKRVPDLAETDLTIGRDGRSLVLDDVEHGVNEWDTFAVEAAVRLKEAHGAHVTAVTVGGPEAEEVLRRALAMGVDEALHLQDAAFDGSDAWGVATIVRQAVVRQPFDLILTGAVSSDDGRGHVGALLAGLLDLPMVALATDLTLDGGTARVRHEVEGGLERITELDLPALITVQTGMNEPRYVSIRGIRKVAGTEIPVRTAADLGIDAATVGGGAARVVRRELFLPPKGEGAELLTGTDDARVTALAERLQQQGAF